MAQEFPSAARSLSESLTGLADPLKPPRKPASTGENIDREKECPIGEPAGDRCKINGFAFDEFVFDGFAVEFAIGEFGRKGTDVWIGTEPEWSGLEGGCEVRGGSVKLSLSSSDCTPDSRMAVVQARDLAGFPTLIGEPAVVAGCFSTNQLPVTAWTGDWFASDEL